MLRRLLEKFSVKSFFKEDPYFKFRVDENLESGVVQVTVTLIRSSASWRGKFSVDSRTEYPLKIQVPKDYERDGEYFLLKHDLSNEQDVMIQFEAMPLQTGSGNVRFWFERKVGIGGQIAVVGTVIGRGDPDAIRKSREYNAKNWNRWLEDNPDW